LNWRSDRWFAQHAAPPAFIIGRAGRDQKRADLLKNVTDVLTGNGGSAEAKLRFG
jgi:hypothetical protein